MKKRLLILWVLMIPFCLSINASAAEIHQFDNSVEELKSTVDDDTVANMEKLGVSDIDITSVKDISLSKTLSLIGDMIAENASGPVASCVMMIAVILLASLLESYTFSLRYVDTKDVMNVVSSLMIILTLVTPVTELIKSAVTVIKGTSTTMLFYVPIMMGIMAFSGHIVSSGAYYTTVMAASQGISQLSSVFFAPIMNCLLAISVACAVSDRVKLSGICELIAKVLKWTITFVMTIFAAILSMQGIASNAADSVASKAVRFSLSSLIPIVGSSVSEAYKSIEGSLSLLRSGLGVFVIIVIIVTFLPLILQILLWQLSIMVAKTAAEVFNVSSTVTIMNAVSSVLSVMLAIIVSITSVFVISSGVLLSVGGGV